MIRFTPKFQALMVSTIVSSACSGSFLDTLEPLKPEQAAFGHNQPPVTTHAAATHIFKFVSHFDRTPARDNQRTPAKCVGCASPHLRITAHYDFMLDRMKRRLIHRQ